jgi:hypothetical protein
MESSKGRQSFAASGKSTNPSPLFMQSRQTLMHVGAFPVLAAQ